MTVVLPEPLGPIDRGDLASRDLQVEVLENDPAAQGHGDIVQGNGRTGISDFGHKTFIFPDIEY